MSNRVIAIGDIHGCARALESLLQRIAPQSSDTIIPLGDVVDRGPQSKQVVERLIELRQQCILRPILGNHEEMMLNVVARGEPPFHWIRHGGSATLDSYGFVGDLGVIPVEHIQFLQSFSDVIETDTHFFVHANYDPDVPIADQSKNMLRWTSLQQYVPGPHQSGRTCVLGHTPDKSGEIFSLHHLKGLDTFCHGGGWLTALDVVAGTIWQANEQGELRGSSSA